MLSVVEPKVLRNPEGCQRVAGGRSLRRPPVNGSKRVPPRRGGRSVALLVGTYSSNENELCCLVLHPYRVPVRIGHDFRWSFPGRRGNDHRLQSSKPSGLLEGMQMLPPLSPGIVL